MANGSAGHFPEPHMQVYTYKHVVKAGGENETVATPTPKLSTNLPEAVWRIGRAQLFDKTFLLLVTLSLAWSTWHYDDKEHAHKAQADDTTGEVPRVVTDGSGNSHAHIVGYTTNPIRIFVAGTLGAVFINVRSILGQYNIWVNEVRLFVAGVLILVLTNYMYSICKQHLENVSRLQQLLGDQDRGEEVDQKQQLL